MVLWNCCPFLALFPRHGDGQVEYFRTDLSRYASRDKGPLTERFRFGPGLGKVKVTGAALLHKGRFI